MITKINAYNKQMDKKKDNIIKHSIVKTKNY